MAYSEVHLRATSQQLPDLIYCEINLKIFLLESLIYLPEVNDLNESLTTQMLRLRRNVIKPTNSMAPSNYCSSWWRHQMETFSA